jgi:hypothetical protein
MISEFGSTGSQGPRNEKVSHRRSPKIVANDHKSKGRFDCAVGGSSSDHVRTSTRLDPAKRAVRAHRAGASSSRKSQRCDRHLPSSRCTVSILQLWCSLNECMSIVDLHRANFGITEGNMAKKAKAKQAAKKKKK